MPTLNWLSRDKDIKQANKTPYRLLTEVSELGYGDSNTENMLIHGDNLEALKALLPFYAGQVKCIYIDPPYNTGSAFEHYDDNLEHSQWLALMYPRLELLRELLAEDGCIWISIDDDEGHYLKVVCDEIFGRNNFVCNAIWHKKHTRANDAKWFSDNHDHILCYAKNKEIWRPNLLPRNESSLSNYSNPDNDPRGIWASGPCHAKTPNEKDIYEITTPSGRKIWPPDGTSWRFSKTNFQQLIEENRIYFGRTGNNVPRYKRFITDVQNGFVPLTIWIRDEVGDNQEAKTEIKALFDGVPFSTPKPERLIQRILTLATNPGDYVLDSFLGSGTTAAVAHKMGRRYIGIEMGEQAKTHCAERLKKVIDGEQGGISKAVGWTGGGGFRFFTLGEAIFDSEGKINENILFENLAAHIWFSETKMPYSQSAEKSTFLGVHNGTAYALLYNGILYDRSISGGNVLTSKILQIIETDLQGQEYDKLIIYGEWCKIGANRLKNKHIEFKQTPYDVKHN
jgi:adenine-specific DNA-methyltransferase